MGHECSYTYEVSSVKCITRLSTDLLLTHGKKKKKKSLLLNIKRPICLVLHQIGLESVAIETPVSVTMVSCLR